MKKMLFALSIIITMTFSHHATANYWGLKSLSFNSNGTNVTKSAFNIGAFASIDIGEIDAMPVAIEADFDTSVVKGRGTISDVGYTWNTKNFAIYSSIRTIGDNYFKIKAGAFNSETSITIQDTEASETTSGLAYGIGFKISNLLIDYTVLQDLDNGSNVTSIISFGVLFL